MKKALPLFLLLLFEFPVWAQDGFQFEMGIDKVSIPFKSINNLVFIPLIVNGVTLNFMLDTGVEETLLFSLDDEKEINFLNVQKISLRGLGSEAAIEGLKSTNNRLETAGLKSSNHQVYIILDQNFNLSSSIGIPVNGIIGYAFFKNNLVEINYSKKRVIVYKDIPKYRKRIEKKYKKVAITIEKSKPYVVGSIHMEEKITETKLLIDIGNSDAVWLFQNYNEAIKVPVKNFDDFLGKGFSGDIEGKRARVAAFKMNDFEFDNPIVAFPDSSSIKNVKMVPNRVGSVGGEIMKRFSVVFDYANEKLYLKKNNEFNASFSYNKGGVEIQHHGLQWVAATVQLQTVLSQGITFDESGRNITNDFKYKFELKPIYEIVNVRKNSAAARSGLQKGDVIVSINKNPGFRYTLEQINAIFKNEEDTWIALEIERNSQLLQFKFQLLDEL